jgi:hypothetical protein
LSLHEELAYSLENEDDTHYAAGGKEGENLGTHVRVYCFRYPKVPAKLFPREQRKSRAHPSSIPFRRKDPQVDFTIFFPSGAPIATPFPTEHNKVRDKINHTSNCCNDN